MTNRRAQAIKFFALTTAIVSAAMAVGYLPTARMGGAGAGVAMLLGGAIALAASWVGVTPILAGAPATVNAVLGATALRLVVVVFLALAAALSGLVPKAALLIWVGICYLLLLVPDSILAASLLKQPHKTND